MDRKEGKSIQTHSLRLFILCRICCFTTNTKAHQNHLAWYSSKDAIVSVWLLRRCAWDLRHRNRITKRKSYRWTDSRQHFLSVDKALENIFSNRTIDMFIFRISFFARLGRSANERLLPTLISSPHSPLSEETKMMQRGLKLMEIAITTSWQCSISLESKQQSNLLSSAQNTFSLSKREWSECWKKHLSQAKKWWEPAAAAAAATAMEEIRKIAVS